ncbi:glycosyltransferase family 2 protein [Candidatus Gottesmanbacteria bacterium]|nr:glycosyltransferase family 2 protein [Candidatus Gottesmanbacteria bacterium]
MKISVIIPNFNGANLLKQNLPKVLSSVEDSEIIVVDDASTDNSVNILHQYFPQVKIIAKDKTEGFSSSVNDGVRKASGDLIVLLNSDVWPNENLLKFLKPYFQDPLVFAVGCLQKSMNREQLNKQGRGIGQFKEGFMLHGPGKYNKTNTLWVFGGAGMYRKKIWNELGGMDPIYNPFYWEDIDISYRAIKAGFKVLFEPKSIVNHEQSTGSIRSFYSPDFIKTIAYRNQILFVWLNITDSMLVLKHIIYLPIHILRAFFARNFPFLDGLLKALIKLPKVLRKRQLNKKLNQRTDREVLFGLGE